MKKQICQITLSKVRRASYIAAKNTRTNMMNNEQTHKQYIRNSHNGRGTI